MNIERKPCILPSSQMPRPIVKTNDWSTRLTIFCIRPNAMRVIKLRAANIPCMLPFSGFTQCNTRQWTWVSLYLFPDDQCSQVIAARGIHYLVLSWASAIPNTPLRIIPDAWKTDKPYGPNKQSAKFLQAREPGKGEAKDISCGLKKYSCLTAHWVGMKPRRTSRPASVQVSIFHRQRWIPR